MREVVGIPVLNPHSAQLMGSNYVSSVARKTSVGNWWKGRSDRLRAEKCVLHPELPLQLLRFSSSRTDADMEYDLSLFEGSVAIMSR